MARQDAYFQQNDPHPDPLPSDGRGNSQTRHSQVPKRLDSPTDGGRFSLSHPMGEGRGEGECVPKSEVVFARVLSAEISAITASNAPAGNLVFTAALHGLPTESARDLPMNGAQNTSSSCGLVRLVLHQTLSVLFLPRWFIREPSMNSLPSPLQQIDRNYVSYRGERFSYFGGCDYFRLAS